MSDGIKTQHYIDSKTGERKPLKVKSIKAKYMAAVGPGGAIKGAERQEPKPAAKALNK